MEKVITFAIPCYNSAEYMDHCISNLLELNSSDDDIEIIIVDDGSTKDFTLEIAKGWEVKHPNVVRAIHQENGGHGQAVNTGLANASGLYFKVVDSDDWLDVENTKYILDYLRTQLAREKNGESATDLVVGNYVYNKVHAGHQISINYRSAFPTEKEIGWADIGHFKNSQYLLMHAVIYKTSLLKEINFKLPKHTFYVDNIFVYVPLPHVKTIYYIDKDMYMYYIGREDQSVNEDVMMSRIDQQIKITKIMIDNSNFSEIENLPKLRKYMRNYLAMMMCICSVFLRKIGDEDSEAKRQEIWEYIEKKDPNLKDFVHSSVLCWATNLPDSIGKSIALTGYKIAQKLFSFN